jgi:hypothetical protein
MFFGGLTGSQTVSSEIVLLDLFSPFDVRYNPSKSQYEYLPPPSDTSASSPAGAVLRSQQTSSSLYRTISNTLSQWVSGESEEEEEYRPVRFSGPT